MHIIIQKHTLINILSHYYIVKALNLTINKTVIFRFENFFIFLNQAYLSI
jgi:hypothetical protein